MSGHNIGSEKRNQRQSTVSLISFFSDGFFFLADLFRLLGTADFYGLNDIKFSLVCVFHPDLSLQITVIRTEGDTVIIFGTGGKPAEFFPGFPL